MLAGGTEALNRSKHNLIKGLASLYRMGLVSAIVSAEVDTQGAAGVDGSDAFIILFNDCVGRKNQFLY